MSTDNDQSQTWHFDCGPGKALPQGKAGDAFEAAVPKAEEPKVVPSKNAQPSASEQKFHVET